MISVDSLSRVGKSAWTTEDPAAEASAFANTMAAAQQQDLQQVLHRAASPVPVSQHGLLATVEGVVQSRDDLKRDIRRVSDVDGHDPLREAVEIQQINRRVGALALSVQVCMKVQQSGIKTIQSLLNGQ